MVLEILKSILMGIVQGVTEWLPISSTGHMLLLDQFLHITVSPIAQRSQDFLTFTRWLSSWAQFWLCWCCIFKG